MQGDWRWQTHLIIQATLIYSYACCKRTCKYLNVCVWGEDVEPWFRYVYKDHLAYYHLISSLSLQSYLSLPLPYIIILSHHANFMRHVSTNMVDFPHSNSYLECILWFPNLLLKVVENFGALQKFGNILIAGCHLQKSDSAIVLSCHFQADKDKLRNSVTWVLCRIWSFRRPTRRFLEKCITKDVWAYIQRGHLQHGCVQICCNNHNSFLMLQESKFQINSIKFVLFQQSKISQSIVAHVQRNQDTNDDHCKNKKK